MKKYFYILILIGFNCFGQVSSNNSETNNSDDSIPFNQVEQIPLYDNCKNLTKDAQRECMVNEINLHIEKTMQYPLEAKKAKVESKVYCTFIINKEGKINIIEARGKPTSFKKAFENEARRIINTLPKFKPGIHSKELINVKCVVVVEFSLGEKIEIRHNENTPIVVMSDETIVGEPNFEDEAIPFQVVEQIPLFEECKSVELENQRECFQEQMKKHIETQLRYPEHAKQFNAQDRVITLFEINKFGYVTNIKVRSRLNDEFRILFESEAKRIIGTLPQFSPGLQRGKPVVVAYSIPINFKL